MPHRGWRRRSRRTAVDRRLDRGQATREQLVTEATRLFAARGFDATSVEAVLEAAGVSRGSLYHHFKSKEALFEAVLDAAEVRIGEATLLAAASAGDDPVDVLRAGALEWIRLAGDPVVQRIVLIDAPAVLGWERWREIEEANALGNLRFAMQAVADDGRHRRRARRSVRAHAARRDQRARAPRRARRRHRDRAAAGRGRGRRAADPPPGEAVAREEAIVSDELLGLAAWTRPEVTHVGRLPMRSPLLPRSGRRDRTGRDRTESLGAVARRAVAVPPRRRTRARAEGVHAPRPRGP